MAYTNAIIDIEAIRHNFRLARRLAGAGKKIMSVVKADAYGHGAVQTAKALEEEGTDYFSVAVLEEGLELREAGIDRPILVLGAIPEREYERAANAGISLAFYDKSQYNAFRNLSHPIKVHIKINTGMERLGFSSDKESFNDLLGLEKTGIIKVEGIFSHLSQADDQNRSFSLKQIDRFRDFITAWEQERGQRPICHLANSAGIFAYPESYFDMVRAGIMLYGANPLQEANPHSCELKQAMTLLSAISQIHWVEPGAEIGYGGTYIAKEPRRIATIPIGYADGYKRILSNQSEVLIRGHRAPQIGNVCMDQIMADITAIPEAKVYDEVVLFGKQGEETISLAETATWAKTISYEILTSIGKRVKRIYR